MVSRYVRLLSFVVVCVFLSGCCSAGFRKMLSGMDRADVLCNARAYAQAYTATPDAVYARVCEEVRNMGAAIFKQDDCRRFLVTCAYHKIYAGTIDTTEVGIAVRETSTPGATDVVVASDNYILAGRVAKDLFSRLAGKEMAVAAPDRPSEPVVGK